MLPGSAASGCCLVSFHFLWAILSTGSVETYRDINCLCAQVLPFSSLQGHCLDPLCSDSLRAFHARWDAWPCKQAWRSAARDFLLHGRLSVGYFLFLFFRRVRRRESTVPTPASCRQFISQCSFCFDQMGQWELLF